MDSGADELEETEKQIHCSRFFAIFQINFGKAIGEHTNSVTGFISRCGFIPRRVIV
jgi:hypothetical protein